MRTNIRQPLIFNYVMGIIFCKCVCLNILFRFRGFFTPGEVVNASSLGILACYKYLGHGCINHCICLSKMSGKKQISILSFAQRGKPPKKARLGPEKVVNTLEEEMVEEEEEETVQVEEEETVEEMVEETVEEMARTKVPEAATYKTSFNSEWTSKWPFITVGSTSSYYWCSICRQENSCAHQGVQDVTRHIGSKGHQAKQQALKSTSTIKNFYLPVTAEMSVQEVKGHLNA